MTATPDDAAGAPAGSDDVGGEVPGAPTAPSTAVKMVAPVASLAATWGVRKVMDSTYRRRTGHAPPRAGDPNASLSKAILWAVVTAAALAAVTVIIDRINAKVSPPA